jgi:hypothetical protein
MNQFKDIEGRFPGALRYLIFSPRQMVLARSSKIELEVRYYLFKLNVPSCINLSEHVTNLSFAGDPKLIFNPSCLQIAASMQLHRSQNPRARCISDYVRPRPVQHVERCWELAANDLTAKPLSYF